MTNMKNFMVLIALLFIGACENGQTKGQKEIMERQKHEVEHLQSEVASQHMTLNQNQSTIWNLQKEADAQRQVAEQQREEAEKLGKENESFRKSLEQLKLRVKVTGTYEHKFDNGDVIKWVLHANRGADYYFNSKKTIATGKWSIVDGEIHLEDQSYIIIYSISPNTDMISIARMGGNENEPRTEIPKDEQWTFKKIK